MATTTVEIAESLAPEDTPIKLRCASCNKLVLNAFRLPCCDQSICESCQTSLPDTCPVCAHTPLSPDNCKPNKALRLTVKAFLKNEEKKREKERAAAALLAAETPPQEKSTPTLPNTASEDNTLLPAATHAFDVIAENSSGLQRPGSPGRESSQGGEVTLDSVEKEQVVPAGTSLQSKSERAEAGEEKVAYTSKDEGRPLENGESRKAGENHPSQQQLGNDHSGYNQMQNGFGNMNWNTGGFNPMLAMQNGMNQGGWGGFNNTMGMPGMGMDPMAMYQGMFGGFNGQGMGMNSMNMGMGFNGGIGGSWGMGGMNGDFGANAGYYPGSGYNQQSHQGHFNQMHDQQFQMNSYQNRSQQGGQGFHHQRSRSHGRWTGAQDFDTANHVQPSREQTRDDSTSHLPAPGKEEEELKEASSEVKETLEETLTVKPDETLPADGTEANVHSAVETVSKVEGETVRPAMTANIDSNATNIEDTTNDESFGEVQTPKLKPIESLDTAGLAPSDADMTPMSAMPPSIDPAVPTGPSTTYGAPDSQDLAYFGRGRGGMRGYTRASLDHRGGHRGRGGYYGHTGTSFVSPTQTRPIEPIGQGVVGAPTGPKAMREGQSVPGIRGRGGLHGRGARVGPVAPPTMPHARSGTVAMTPSRSRSRTRSRSPSHPRRRGSPVYHEQQHKDDKVEQGSEDHRSRKDSRQAEDDQRSRDEPRSRGDSEGAESRHRSRHHSERHRSSRKDHEHDREREHDRKRRKRDHSEDQYVYDEDEHDRRRSSKDLSSYHDKEHHHEHREKRSRRRERHRDRERRSRHDRSRSQSSEKLEDDHARGHDRIHSASHDYGSRNSRSRSDNTSPVANGEGPPPSAPSGPASSRREVREFKIHGRSKMQPPARPSMSSANSHGSATARPTPPTAPKSDLDIAKQQVLAEKPDMDEHALEREARNRDRLLKEQQRRGIPTSGGERKRSFGTLGGDRNGDDGEASGSGKGRKMSKGGRRVSYQYEGEDEDRAARVEMEREAERWR